MYHETSMQIHTHLTNERNNLIGRTTFQMSNLSIDIQGTDSIGNLIQEWFGNWAVSQNYPIALPDGSTQAFPDFFINNGEGLLEVKTFNAQRSPAFDVANFEAYCLSLAENPQRLFADYLIFSYEKLDLGIRIDNIWLKKIWEITGESNDFPLKVQVKYRDRENNIYSIDNIRPIVWYSERNNVAQPFESYLDFVEALYGTQQIYRRGYSNRDLFYTNYNRLLQL